MGSISIKWLFFNSECPTFFTIFSFSGAQPFQWWLVCLYAVVANFVCHRSHVITAWGIDQQELNAWQLDHIPIISLSVTRNYWLYIVTLKNAIWFGSTAAESDHAKRPKSIYPFARISSCKARTGKAHPHLIHGYHPHSPNLLFVPRSKQNTELDIRGDGCRIDIKISVSGLIVNRVRSDLKMLTIVKKIYLKIFFL